MIGMMRAVEVSRLSFLRRWRFRTKEELGGGERRHGGVAGEEAAVRINAAAWETRTSPRGEDTMTTRRVAYRRLGNRRGLYLKMTGAINFG
jgi:hypothetical protein